MPVVREAHREPIIREPHEVFFIALEGVELRPHG